MAAPSDALSSTLSAALEQVSVGSAVAATTTTALVDPATAARENETLLSALELSAASSLEHVLAREVAVSCGLAAGAGGVHGGGGSSGGVVDVPRLQEVLRQAEASIQATPHAWVNVTAASRIFDIGRSRVTAALGAAATVQRTCPGHAHDMSETCPGRRGGEGAARAWTESERFCERRLLTPRACAKVQRELERLAPPPSSSAGEGRGPALLARSLPGTVQEPSRKSGGWRGAGAGAAGEPGLVQPGSVCRPLTRS